MTALIPYAGFDPDENDFEGVDPAPLHRHELRKQPRTRIDINRAWHLKGLGRSWADIGRQIAIEEGRPIAYGATAIRFAAMYAKPIRGAGA